MCLPLLCQGRLGRLGAGGLLFADELQLLPQIVPPPVLGDAAEAIVGATKIIAVTANPQTTTLSFMLSLHSACWTVSDRELRRLELLPETAAGILDYCELRLLCVKKQTE